MDNKEIKAKLSELNTASQGFRPDGAARGVMRKYQEIAEELYEKSYTLDSIRSDMKKYEKALEERNKQVAELSLKVEKLSRSEFSFDEFQKYLSQLYRVLKLSPTFRVKNKEDFPQLIDFLFTEYAKKGGEPDLP